jgi:hypothetical protein
MSNTKKPAETYFVNAQMTLQDGKGEAPTFFTCQVQIHAFVDGCITGEMPMLNLTEQEQELINEASQMLAGYAKAIYQLHYEKEEGQS